ncbi:hypothetical protein [Bordetella pseudohinzii]|uniref:Uncharacterized protein n=1 Tax=Bordetella pseudohinzii TaxID=1331258 RepID=A0A0J6F4D4_9BORD|nr:hypothetical protein [Bordetella pseudohinzii]ANY15384.1 hypothetical protein BBN53_05460 [Bordetella pseudohinzii]KMM27305.1 hypothetical protein L540_09920 [Bordetella pseudohinzii]KXA79394.1 hypothetical protein AW877_09135 [Bordetella pseudohinzii]KXA82511.1 hypothetical protein AW878_00530 [Bordetella pseudohinzii]CUI86566.1 Uncharacterised protein [Bordetella pseudohinzii]
MTASKWDFRVERPAGHDGDWRIAYILLAPDGAEQRIDIEQHYPAAQTAIAEATRLAQIQVADLNGEAPEFNPPDTREVPFDPHTRF